MARNVALKLPPGSGQNLSVTPRQLRAILGLSDSDWWLRVNIDGGAASEAYGGTSVIEGGVAASVYGGTSPIDGGSI